MRSRFVVDVRHSSSHSALFIASFGYACAQILLLLFTTPLWSDSLTTQCRTTVNIDRNKLSIRLKVADCIDKTSRRAE